MDISYSTQHQISFRGKLAHSSLRATSIFSAEGAFLEPTEEEYLVINALEALTDGNKTMRQSNTIKQQQGQSGRSLHI